MADTLEAPASLPLIGVAEIAAMLGVDRRSVYDMTMTRDWPEPLAHLATGSVWRASDIHRWAQSNIDYVSPQAEGFMITAAT